jgi:hypothetical protein
MAMIYLIDGRGHLIGPFENRENVERFIGMMALCGENWADNKIVWGGGDDAPGQNPAQMDSWSNRLKSTSKLKLVGRRP